MAQPRTPATRITTASQIYQEAGLIYIRYHAEIEDKPNGQKKIGGSRPCFSRIEKQINYGSGDGRYYSLLMGREFQPGKFVILLDFDNKAEGETRNGMELAETLNLDRLNAPKQKTPSGGLHYLFWVDEEQGKNIRSRTGICYNGVQYNMDVKFKNSLCNCAPSKIAGYGEYKWTNPSKLRAIPQLPDDIYNLITSNATASSESSACQRQETRARATHPVAPATQTVVPATQPVAPATEHMQSDIRALCECLNISQIDNYQTWVRLGMILKNLGMPVEFWEEVSQKSKKYKMGECRRKWGGFRTGTFRIGSLIVMAKEGNLEAYEQTMPKLHLTTDVFRDDVVYPCIKINSPFLTTKNPDEAPVNEDQGRFREVVKEFTSKPEAKSLVMKSRYGSGKTTFMQRLIEEHKPEKVLFITYRQTLARDIMRNFGQLGFKSYLDSHDDPTVWDCPRLIVQLDSLLKVITHNSDVMCGDAFDLNYDMIVLDESESLLNHFDEKTMEGKEIQIWEFLDELLKHTKKVVMMDGDVSERTLSFAKSYGYLTYVQNTNNETNKSIHIVRDQGKWETQLHSDLKRFHEQDHNFRVCIVSQSSSQAVSLEESLRDKFPNLTVRRLVGTDCGATKKQVQEDINKYLENVNVFIYSPVIESGVDITVPVKKLYGTLSCKSSSQRAYLQMLARCRNVEDGRIDILNDVQFRINKNHYFWTYKEVQELNKDTVQPGMRMVVSGDHMRLADTVDVRRKDISVFNHVERLNKHPCLFINYLRVLAKGKGMGFTIDDEGKPNEPRKNYRLEAILQAKDITKQEYKEIATRKKRGETTLEENVQAERYFWKRYLAQDDLDRELLVEFMYDNNPLNNFLCLIDERNHVKEDNLRSAKFLEQAGTVKKLLKALGFDGAMDWRKKISRETFLKRWAENVVEVPEFQSKRINELWNLAKSRRIEKDMSMRQIMPWVNNLLKPFGLQLKADHMRYSLTTRFEVMGLIRRKNSRGRYFKDQGNLLKQKPADDEHAFDEQFGEMRWVCDLGKDLDEIDVEFETGSTDS
jgi:hypothetical protein